MQHPYAKSALFDERRLAGIRIVGRLASSKVRNWAFADVGRLDGPNVRKWWKADIPVYGSNMEWTSPQHAAILNWRQQGKVWLHRYEPPLPSLRGWHFVADPAGTASLLELFALVPDTMQHIERSIKLQPKLVSDHHPIDQSQLKRHSIVTPTSFKLSIDLDSEIAWKMAEEPDRLTLRLNRSGFDEIRGGLIRYQRGSHPHRTLQRLIVTLVSACDIGAE